MPSTRFTDDPDFKASPLKAILKRISWRLYWKLHPNTPLLVRGWWNGMKIMLPKSGAAAQVYYRKFSSPQILNAITEMLREGMVVFDIGAHAGEYTLIAASLVGPRGRVFAFEPQAQLAALIRANCEENDLSNAEVYECAVGRITGEIGFTIDRRSLGGWTSQLDSGVQPVPCMTLDDFVERHAARPDLIKIDAAGSELAVLAGGRRTLQRFCPMIILQLYHPEVTHERHGYHVGAVIETLTEHGYDLCLLDAPVPGDVLAIRSFEGVDSLLRNTNIYSLALCATRRVS